MDKQAGDYLLAILLLIGLILVGGLVYSGLFSAITVTPAPTVTPELANSLVNCTSVNVSDKHTIIECLFVDKLMHGDTTICYYTTATIAGQDRINTLSCGR